MSDDEREMEAHLEAVSAAEQYFAAADAENYLPLPQGPARLVAVLEAAIADCKKQLSRLKCAMWNDAAMTNYAIALQRAIEHHCRGQSVPDYIAKQCPHHAQLLNAHLESAASLLRVAAGEDEKGEHDGEA